MTEVGKTLNNMGVLHSRLHGRLWHTTSIERFCQILIYGGLIPNPPIEDAKRWKSSLGPDYYPFVRKIGGVSLFDFENFDPDSYDRTYPMSSWRTFVPHLAEWGGAVWIEIDRSMIADHFIPANELIQMWDEGGHHRHTIMPRIEAAHLGYLSRPWTHNGAGGA
ncbi:MAG: hypothetical protein ACOYO0_09120 [Sandarakinorhabdus sp.]